MMKNQQADYAFMPPKLIFICLDLQKKNEKKKIS